MVGAVRNSFAGSVKTNFIEVAKKPNSCVRKKRLRYSRMLGLIRSSRPDATFRLELPFMRGSLRLEDRLFRAMAQEDRKLFWSRENEVDEEWIHFVDDNVHARETL